MRAHGSQLTTKRIIRKIILPQQARNRLEDVQNLSICDCACLGSTYGKFACFCSIEGYSQNHSTHLRTRQAHAT